MFFIGNVKRCIVFVSWKRKTPQEEFETKRNLSCDSTEYIFSVTIRTPSRQYNLITVVILQKSAELHNVYVNRLLKLENSY